MTYHLNVGNTLDVYQSWPTPTCIVSDGAYGVKGFFGDTSKAEDLADWYAPHVDAWSKAATPRTSLWFWNTEVGWASVHPLLVAYGWRYVQTVTWDKGISHVAGNVNGDTIRTLPVVSEIAVLYERRQMPLVHGITELRDWLRAEWKRTGLPFYLANQACGVKSAATRKYLAPDDLWYMPPVEHFIALAQYANQHGDPHGAPYFVTSEQLATASDVLEAAKAQWGEAEAVREAAKVQWEATRRVWNHTHGLTNVWAHPPLRASERVKGSGRKSAPRAGAPTAISAAHLNQKPLELMRRQVAASSNPGDTVWEPFGGLASASVAALELGRVPYVSEIDPHFAAIAEERLDRALLGDGLAAA